MKLTVQFTWKNLLFLLCDFAGHSGAADVVVVSCVWCMLGVHDWLPLCTTSI